MRPLIIIALIILILLPALKCVLDIMSSWEITFGDSITIGIAVVTSVILIIIWIRKQTLPNRAYKMSLFDSSIDKVISENKEVEEFKVYRDNLAQIYVKIIANVGTNITNISFSLVKRLCPCQWEIEKSRYVFIESIWDKDLEDEHAINSSQSSRRTPLYRQENGTGVLHFDSRNTLKGDVMWFRVIAHANIDWEGYLEYCGPSGDNRRAYTRKKIILRLNHDKVDSQT